MCNSRSTAAVNQELHICLRVLKSLVEVFSMLCNSLSIDIPSSRFETKEGRDMNDAVPRCIMAAKFISQFDPTGETALAHWISVGQIQDSRTLPPYI